MTYDPHVAPPPSVMTCAQLDLVLPLTQTIILPGGESKLGCKVEKLASSFVLSLLLASLLSRLSRLPRAQSTTSPSSAHRPSEERFAVLQPVYSIHTTILILPIRPWARFDQRCSPPCSSRHVCSRSRPRRPSTKSKLMRGNTAPAAVSLASLSSSSMWLPSVSPCSCLRALAIWLCQFGMTNFGVYSRSGQLYTGAQSQTPMVAVYLLVPSDWNCGVLHFLRQGEA